MDSILFDTLVMLLFLVKLNVLNIRYAKYVPVYDFNHCRNPRDFYQLHFFSSEKYNDKIFVGLNDGFKYEKFDKISILCLF